MALAFHCYILGSILGVCEMVCGHQVRWVCFLWVLWFSFCSKISENRGWVFYRYSSFFTHKTMDICANKRDIWKAVVTCISSIVKYIKGKTFYENNHFTGDVFCSKRKLYIKSLPKFSMLKWNTCGKLKVNALLFVYSYFPSLWSSYKTTNWYCPLIISPFVDSMEILV